MRTLVCLNWLLHQLYHYFSAGLSLLQGCRFNCNSWLLRGGYHESVSEEPPSSIEIDKGTTVNSATFKLVPISRETFWGDAGSCTLDYLSEGYIQWTITVPGAVIVSFEGNLHFNKLGTPFGTFDHAISAYGTIGTEDVKYGLSKGKWEVEFTGIATAANGDMYSVVDGATLAFSVTK